MGEAISSTNAEALVLLGWFAHVCIIQLVERTNISGLVGLLDVRDVSRYIHIYMYQTMSVSDFLGLLLTFLHYSHQEFQVDDPPRPHVPDGADRRPGPVRHTRIRLRVEWKSSAQHVPGAWGEDIHSNAEFTTMAEIRVGRHWQAICI